MHRLHTQKDKTIMESQLPCSIKCHFLSLGGDNFKNRLFFYAYGSFIALKINSALTAAVSPFKLPRLEKVCTVCTHTNAHYSLSHN